MQQRIVIAKIKCERLGCVFVGLYSMINARCNLERSLLSLGRCVRQVWDIQISSKTLCSSFSYWTCRNL